MSIRLTEVTDWHNFDPTEAGGEVTVAELLESVGWEFNPETHRIVSAKEGVIKPETKVGDGDTVFLEPLEGEDVDDDDLYDEGGLDSDDDEDDLEEDDLDEDDEDLDDEAPNEEGDESPTRS